MSGKALFFTAVLLLAFSGLVTWAAPILLFATEPDIPPPTLSDGTAPATPGTGPSTASGSGSPGASRSTPRFQPGGGGFVPPQGFPPPPDFSHAPGFDTQMKVTMAVMFGLVLLAFISLAKAFAIMGEPWWAAFIPIYQTYIMIRIARRPGYWLLLCFLPCINIIVFFIVCLDFVKPYGKGTLMGLLLFFFPFIALPAIAFTSSPPSAWDDAMEA